MIWVRAAGDIYFGYGRINALRACEMADGGYRVNITLPITGSYIHDNQIVISGRAFRLEGANQTDLPYELPSSLRA